MGEKEECLGTAAHPFPYVKASMCFSWLCTECYEVNHYDYDNWSVYSGTAECGRCEKAHTVLEPWNSYTNQHTSTQQNNQKSEV
jgi:hypothetical protein